MEKLILIGAGGYAKSVLDSVDYYNYKVQGFIDEFSEDEQHLGYPILAKSLDEIENKESYVYFITIGNNTHRERWYKVLVEKKLRYINIVDKSAIISSNATIGNGCFIGKMAIVNSRAVIGDNCIVNTKALVEHGCTVGKHVNLSTNSVINGDVVVGDGTFIGSGSVTIGQLKIGSNVTVGAGAVITKDVRDDVVVAGVPAREMERKTKDE